MKEAYNLQRCKARQKHLSLSLSPHLSLSLIKTPLGTVRVDPPSLDFCQPNLVFVVP